MHQLSNSDKIVASKGPQSFGGLPVTRALQLYLVIIIILLFLLVPPMNVSRSFLSNYWTDGYETLHVYFYRSEDVQDDIRFSKLGHRNQNEAPESKTLKP